MNKLFKNEWFQNMGLAVTVITAMFITIMLPGNFRIILANDNTVDINPISKIEQVEDKIENIPTGEDILPSVSIEQATGILMTKGYDVVYMLQKIIKPVAAAAMIILFFMTIFGAIGDSSLLWKGLIGIAIVALCYFIIQNAPELLEFLNGWMAEGTEEIFNPNPF